MNSLEESIEYFENIKRLDVFDNHTDTVEKTILILLKLVTKQQKEIEDLRSRLRITIP